MGDLKKINDSLYELNKKSVKIEMLYSETGKTLEDCIINILKSKINQF